MKLEVIEKYPLEGVKNWIRQVAVTTNGWTAFLFYKEYHCYSLVFIREGNIVYREIKPEETSGFHGNDIVVFSCQDKICILKNIYEIEVVTNPGQPSFFIPVKNGNFLKKVIPDSDLYKRAQLRSLHIISEGPLFPVGFEWDGFQGDIRNIGYLELDVVKGCAQWVDFVGIKDSRLFPDLDNRFIKYDSGMMTDDRVYFFCPGSAITSTYKWGMDWYALLEADRKGRIKEVVINSGLLRLIDEKKRGVNGVFTYSKQYVILTPVFNSDEWKGKQKLFDLATRNFIELQMPRGLAKGRIVQHTGKEFWVCSNNENNLYLAVCREV